MNAARALLLASALACAGCAREDDARTTLRLWAMGREGEVVGQLVPEFERRHPGLRIVVQQQPWTAAHEKLLTAFAGDALPDLGQMGNTWLPEFAALHALAPLDGRVAASAVVKADDYFAGIWDTNRIDGTLYGVPWYVDTRLVFYRSDLLAAAGVDAFPENWETWKAAMAKLKAQAGPDKYAILLPLNEYEEILSFALQEDDPLLRENDTRGNFESPGFRRAFAFYTGLFDAGYAPPMSDTQISNVWDEFAAGFYAFYITGPWNIGEFRRRLPPALDGRWATAPLPGPHGPGAGLAGGTSLVVFAGSPHADAAWQFVEYLSEPAQQLRFHALTGDLPARRSAWDAPQLAGDALTHAFRDQLERVKAVPKLPEWEHIAIAVRLAVERVVRGHQDVDATLRALDVEADKILAKRRELMHEAR